MSETVKYRSDAERYRHLRRCDVDIEGCAMIYCSDELDKMVDASIEAFENIVRADLCEPLGAWVPVAERLPAAGQTVLACYRNRANNVRRIRAHWIAAKTEESSGDNDFGEYDEAADTYWTPEGWYEQIDNWGDYSAVAVCEGEVSHWMPLPAPPASA